MQMLFYGFLKIILQIKHSKTSFKRQGETQFAVELQVLTDVSTFQMWVISFFIHVQDPLFIYITEGMIKHDTFYVYLVSFSNRIRSCYESVCNVLQSK